MNGVEVSSEPGTPPLVIEGASAAAPSQKNAGFVDPGAEGADKQLGDEGLQDYADLQRQLSETIAPNEAQAARKLFQTSSITLLAALAAAILLAVLERVLVGDGDPGLRFWLLSSALPVVASMLLVSKFRVPWAGRVLMVLCALILPHPADNVFGEALSNWILPSGGPTLDAAAYPLQLLGSLLPPFFVGWAIDTGATSEWGGLRRRRWAIRLTLLALAYALLQLFSTHLIDKGDERILGAWIRSVLVMLWVWGGHQLVADRRRFAGTDVSTVFIHAIRRWGRRLLGRGLAVFSLLILAIGTLNGVALQGAFELGGNDKAVRLFLPLKEHAEAQDLYLFWPRHGRFLREGDFSGRNFYVLTDAPRQLLVDTDMSDAYAAGARGFLLFGNRDSIERMSALSSWRTDSADDFRLALLNNADKSFGSQDVWVIERYLGRARPGGWMDASDKPGDPVYLFEPLHTKLEPISAMRVPMFDSMRIPSVLGGSLFACLGFVVLWRRGGDSPAARRVGFWFIGIGFGMSALLMRFVAGALQQTATVTSDLQVNATLFAFVLVATLWSALLAMLAILGVPILGVYFALRPRAVRPRYAGQWKQRVGRALEGKFASLCLCFVLVLTLVQLVQIWGSQPARLMVAFGLAEVALIALMELARRRMNLVVPHADERLRLGQGALILLAAGQGCLYYFVAALLNDAAQANLIVDWQWHVVAVLAIYGILATYYLLRTDWLRLSGGRDFSWLATVFVLPILFELFNGYLPGWLELAGVFLPGAASAAALVVVVALMQPIQAVLQATFVRVASPGLHRIQTQVDAIVERAIADPSALTVGEELEKLFAQMGISDYALYVRNGSCTFQRDAGGLGELNSILTISRDLCKKFSHLHAVADLEAVHSEWGFFFEQFELHQLATKTGARFIYPVRIGRALWGLLMLGGSPAATRIARDTFSSTANDIGVLLSKWKR